MKLTARDVRFVPANFMIDRRVLLALHSAGDLGRSGPLWRPFPSKISHGGRAPGPARVDVRTAGWRSWYERAPTRAVSYQDLSSAERRDLHLPARLLPALIMRLAATNRTPGAVNLMIDGARWVQARTGPGRDGTLGDRGMFGGGVRGWGGCRVSGWWGTRGWRNRGRGRGVIPGERPQQHPPAPPARRMAGPRNEPGAAVVGHASGPTYQPASSLGRERGAARVREPDPPKTSLSA